MNNKVFSNISKIIERDSKSTTYKFALLRGTIDIVQENSPFISIVNNRVFIPTGLLIEKWLLYYYPILQSSTLIPQINNSNKLAFELQFIELIKNYESRGGFSAFYNDLKNKGIPNDLNDLFFELAKKIRNTITKMPMKYIGRSVNQTYYSIYQYENKQRLKKSDAFDIEKLINGFGVFSIPIDYHEVFKLLGSFINGQDSILFKWAEFSVNASNKNLSIEKVISEVLKNPITERDILESKKLYKSVLEKKGTVYCVWTGKKISKYDIDHVIPFTVWKNNDLWNLLPSSSTINRNNKRDKIPSPILIEKQKDIILDYWDTIFKEQSSRFKKEIQIALLGNHPFSIWKEKGIEQLQRSCNYLIENRGFEEWKI
ncbi:HNH endonuclease domain-containing protein [Flavobacteriaceae bacterium 14752]|uniref:HNH endonuclease domain-containing protein n=1 Tax=Mesohalobacter salilacus TaxID=2491711 RepID=UPI000F62F551|nr:hypothetical protein EIG84_09145 [Flavobacteriaceae bacterium 14752]